MDSPLEQTGTSASPSIDPAATASHLPIDPLLLEHDRGDSSTPAVSRAPSPAPSLSGSSSPAPFLPPFTSVEADSELVEGPSTAQSHPPPVFPVTSATAIEAYVTELNAHILSLRPPSPLPYRPSLHPPSTLWTPHEKHLLLDVLLPRYSRFRPDVIAEHLGPSKSEADVLAYLDELGRAKRAWAEGTHASRRKRRGWVGRKDMPEAREVSEMWVLWEDEAADVVRRRDQEDGGKARVAKKRKVDEEDAEREPTCAQQQTRSTPPPPNPDEPLFTRLRAHDACVVPRLPALTPSFFSLLFIACSPPPNAPGPSETSAAPTPSTSANPTPDHDPESDAVLLLSPASRKRYNKRMHMRRARARERGEELRPEEEGVEILQTRRKGGGRPRIPGGKTDQKDAWRKKVLGDRADAVLEKEKKREQEERAKEEEEKRKAAQDSLEALGLTPGDLSASFLDVLDYETLSTIITRFRTPSDPLSPSPANGEDPSLDPAVLPALRDHLLAFLVPLLGRTIDLVVEQRRARSSTKTFTGTYDTVTKDDVYLAMRLSNIPCPDRPAPPPTRRRSRARAPSPTPSHDSVESEDILPRDPSSPAPSPEPEPEPESALPTRTPTSTTPAASDLVEIIQNLQRLPPTLPISPPVDEVDEPTEKPKDVNKQRLAERLLHALDRAEDEREERVLWRMVGVDRAGREGSMGDGWESGWESGVESGVESEEMEVDGEEEQDGDGARQEQQQEQEREEGGNGEEDGE